MQNSSMKQLKQPIALSLLFISISTALYAQDSVEEVFVTGRQELLETEFTAKRNGANVEAVKPMNQIPGGARPLTEQIRYRGMSGPRAMCASKVARCLEYYLDILRASVILNEGFLVSSSSHDHHRSLIDDPQ